ncbi:MAG: hypothetical protein LLF76_05550 [Planctomycetaceae bacterium]|nr:hypothetical protein [Planctomycetaceae bacterium]
MESVRLLQFSLALTALAVGWASAVPGGADEPVRYIGDVKASNSGYDNGYHDGQLRPAIGVQNYQIMRANRTHPEWSDGLGWTYNHAPMLAYANGQFYCQYLTTPSGEHIAPGMTMLTRSQDGKNWTKPEVLFPIYFTADPNTAAITYTVMHQRMGFYRAPNGRFLTMGFYGPPYGDGVGRVVREIYPDDSLGPLYFIRVNDHWQGPVLYPLYTASSDQGFVEACRMFLVDKVRRVQWWEEDQFANDRDEFYRVSWGGDIGRSKPAKAFCFYTRADGAVIGFFKDRWTTMTWDQGETWSPLVRCETLTYDGAKIWAQRLDNGQYALVYNPTDTAARHPLSIAISEDGILFDNLVNVHGELPPKRYWGRERRPGPQYVRGIIEGNGNPPGDDLWVVYSMSKEDIWTSRIPIPVRWQVTGPIRDDFSKMQTGGVVKDWNIYAPKWCPVEVVDFPSRKEKSLRIKDADAYDYAQAVRVFQKGPQNTLHYQLYIESAAQAMDVEIVGAKGERLVQTRIGTDGTYLAKEGEDCATAGTLQTARWHLFEFRLDSLKREFSIELNGKAAVQEAAFSEETGEPERIIFRTGPYRLQDKVQKYKSGDEKKPGWDEPGADEPVSPAVYYLKDFGATATPNSVLEPDQFSHYIREFNEADAETIVNAISNNDAWAWMQRNIPLFECSEKTIEQIYYYRWWTFRKHLKETPDGYVFTEFLKDVGHAGKYNTISCALGHHIQEGTWLHDQDYIDQYAKFWFTGNDGGLQPHLHKYSNWAAAALYRRYLVNKDDAFITNLLDAFVSDYEGWVKEKRLENGLFWQYDVRDGMEESISGGRKVQNIRPPLNSYLYANAEAISKVAALAGRKEITREYSDKAKELRRLVQEMLWDKEAGFFKVRYPNGALADVREELGFIPWCFNLPQAGYEEAWTQLMDRQGFSAPMGIMTAERRHPQFRSHGIGTCEWDGAVWPFATSQTLTALANLLRDYKQDYVTKADYYQAILTYAKSQQRDGKPYIGEYLDEVNGQWLTPDSDRSRFYNHSTFCDLVISGLAGLVPRSDDIIEVDPLVPAGTWDWFCLDRIIYHGRWLTIVWDRTGEKYNKGKGLHVLVDNRQIAHSANLRRLTVRMPSKDKD